MGRESRPTLPPYYQMEKEGLKEDAKPSAPRVSKTLDLLHTGVWEGRRSARAWPSQGKCVCELPSLWSLLLRRASVAGPSDS